MTPSIAPLGLSAPRPARVALPPEAAGRPTWREQRAFLWALATIAILQLLLFLGFMRSTAVFGLFYDMADWLLDYARYQADGDLAGYLWSPHDEHRLAITRLVLLADIKLFAGVSYPFVAVSLSCVAIVAAILLRTVDRGGSPGMASWIVSFLMVMLFFNPAVAIACSVPVYDNYPHAIGLVAASLYLFDAADTRSRRPGLRRSLALLAATGAGLGSAIGLLVWPILLWAAWRGRLSRTWIAATALFGAAYIALYTHGNGPLAAEALFGGTRAIFSVPHLQKSADYFLRYMGLPWSHEPGLLIPGKIIGVVLTLVILAVIVRRGIAGPAGGLRERVPVGTLIFVLGTAVLASLTRVDIVDPHGNIYVPIKYTIFLSAAHAALAATALPWIAQLWQRPDRRRALQAATLALGAMLIVQTIGLGEAATAKAARANVSIARFTAGQQDGETHLFVHLSGGIGDRARAFMRAAKIYDFRP